MHSAASGASAVDTVVAEIERIIFDDLEVGATLPSEGELARSLNVSRLTVREGVRNLQARGLVETSKGRRPVVAALGSDPLSDFFEVSLRRDPGALLELLEVRQALEVHIAAVAARRATRAHLDLLAGAVQGMRDVADDPERLHDADVHFHEILAAATGNRLLSLLLESLSGPLRASRISSYAGHVRRRIPVSEGIEQHQTLLDAVRGKNPDAAAAAMRRHLKSTEKDLVAAMRANL